MRSPSILEVGKRSKEEGRGTAVWRILNEIWKSKMETWLRFGRFGVEWSSFFGDCSWPNDGAQGGDHGDAVS